MQVGFRIPTQDDGASSNNFEGASGVNVTPDDPLHLQLRKKEGVSQLRSRKKGGFLASRRIRTYYQRQNNLIENYLKPIAVHCADAQVEMERTNRLVRAIIILNIVSTFALAAIQLYAAVSSLSLSLFATAADSVCDPFANIMLNWIHHRSKRLDKE